MRFLLVGLLCAVLNGGFVSWVYLFGRRHGRRVGYSEGWCDGVADVKLAAEMSRRPKQRFEAAFREVDSKTMPIDLEVKAKETES